MRGGFKNSKIRCYYCKIYADPDLITAIDQTPAAPL